MDKIGKEWLKYLGKEDAVRELKIICLCALHSRLKQSPELLGGKELNECVFKGVIDPGDKDPILLAEAFDTLDNPGDWLVCAGITHGAEELENFLAGLQTYSNGYCLVPWGEAIPDPVLVFRGEDPHEMLARHSSAELAKLELYRVVIDASLPADAYHYSLLSRDSVLSEVPIGVAASFMGK